MKKKLIIIVLAILIVFALTITSCGKNNPARTLVAKIDNQKIFKNKYDLYWENVKSQNNITDETLQSPETAEEIKNLRNEVLEYVVFQEILKIEFDELGYYNLTEEEHESAKTQKDTILTNWLNSKESEILEELGEDYTEKDRVKMENKYIQKFYDEIKLTEKELLDYFIDAAVYDKAKAELVVINVTEEDMQMSFDEIVAKDKEFFDSNLEAYEHYATQGGYTPYYVPEGFRYVRHVLIKLDDNTIAEISSLRNADDDTAADALLEESLKDLQAEADEALEFLQNGDITMDEAIIEYNDDPGMTSYPEGYMMYSGSKTYLEAFTEAGMMLENIGDISGLVATDFGYHIIEYTSDVTPGEIDIEDVYDEVYDDALETLTKEAWNTITDSWIEKHEITYFYENLTVGEVTATTEEPSTTENVTGTEENSATEGTTESED